MNAHQRVIVKVWKLSLAFFVLLGFLIMMHETIPFGLSLFIATGAYLLLMLDTDVRNHMQSGWPSDSMGAFLIEHKGLKFYMLFSCLFVALPFIFWFLSSNASMYWMLVPLGILIIPMFVVAEIQKYRAAGNA